MAAAYLRSLGWELLARNWRCPDGEVDLVALDNTGVPTTVIVEVKTRSGLGFGDPLESITVAKLAKLRTLALCWRQAHPEQRALRIDAIGVLRTANGPRLRHVRGLT